MDPVDCHCHLDFDRFDGDRDEVVRRSDGNLEFVVNAGRGPESNRATVKLAAAYPDSILPNLGLHPTSTEDFSRIDEVKKQIRRENPPAIGEIGLDHYHIETEETRREQEQAFRELLQLAEELEKPVVVHSREAEKKAVDILSEYSIPGIMLHCFNGRTELASRATDKGMMIGVTTQVLYSSRVQEIAEVVDTGSILLETDSPFLYRGKRNEPSNLTESAEKIAELKDSTREKIVKTTTSSARAFFRR